MARHIRDKTMLKQRVQTTEPKLEHHKELPLHICKLPLSQSMQEGHLEMHDKEQTKLTLHRAVKPPAQVAYVTPQVFNYRH
jgi:hypothetical protein